MDFWPSEPSEVRASLALTAWWLKSRGFPQTPPKSSKLFAGSTETKLPLSPNLFLCQTAAAVSGVGEAASPAAAAGSIDPRRLSQSGRGGKRPSHGGSTRKEAISELHLAKGCSDFGFLPTDGFAV